MSEGRAIRLSGAHTDVTEFKQAIEMARHREEFIRRMNTAARDAMITIDPQGCVAMWNNAAERIFGHRREDILGRPLHDFLAPPDARKMFAHAFPRFQASGEGAAVDQIVELEALCADGSLVPVELSLAAVPIDGSFWATAIARDLTERKAQERALEESRARAEALLDAVHAGIVIVDPQKQTIVEANNVAAEMFGVSLAEFEGRSCRESLCPPERMACPSHDSRDPIFGREVNLPQADGSMLSVVKSVVPFRHGDGDLLVESIVDITEQKRTQEKLRVAVAEAESAARAKSEFLANMSHEIRTPMNAVIGMTRLTLDSELTADQRENLDIVSRSAEALLALIDDILDFSKIEAGKLVVEETDFDLPALVEGTLDTLAVKADEKNIELLSYVAPDLPQYVRGDPNRLRQVLLNLLGNAVKFTAQGEVVLSVDGQKSEDGQDRFRFSVRDTGIGIGADKLAGIFESFVQADGSTSRRFGGTGLGLTISRRLSELMGGSVDVESELGVGSTFSVTLPLVAATTPREARSQRPGTVRGCHVLICDDNETNRLLLEKQLAAWGCHTTSVDSGPAALDAVAARENSATPFDVLLLDHAMPEMTGMDVAMALRDREAARRLPVLLLSSVSGRFPRDELRAAGVDNYLLKPLKAQQLADSIAALLPGKPGGGDASAPASTGGAAPSPLAGRHVLLVEDQVFNQKVAVKYLEREGLHVTVAGDGAQAVDLVQRERFDAVLMDVQMPVLDGLEATRRIRLWEDEHPNVARLPIIAMTAHAMQGDRERCLDAGMDDYITKPLRPEAMFTALDRWIFAVGSNESDEALAPSPDAAPDLSGVIERFGDDPEFLAELYEVFEEQSREQVAAMTQALQAGDADALARDAHAAKGSSRNFGLDELGNLFFELEQRGRSGALGDADAILTQTAERLERTLATLREHIGAA